MSRKYDFRFVKSFIEQRDGTLLSTEYINTKTKLHIKCNFCDSEEYRSFDLIYRLGIKCQNCKIRGKYVWEQVNGIINKRGGQLLTNTYKTLETRLDILCNKCNYKWNTRLSKILAGRWCPNCAGNAPKTYEFIKNEIKKRNGILLSKYYKNNATPIKIQCNDCKYIWKAPWTTIQKNEWCPKCALHKTQKHLFKIIKDIYHNYDVYCNYRNFDWLKTKNNRKQEIDIYIPALKFAIEYDGEQHFKAIKYFGGKSRFIGQKKLDKLKNQKIKDHPEDIRYFIRFNYKENLTQEYVLNKLIENKIFVRTE